MHFASCSTDSTISIWHVNEHCKFRDSSEICVSLDPLRTMDCKANGLTFDPFGKFLASQSSEEKKLTIWRIQNYKNLTKECEIDAYYKSQTIS